MIRKSEAIKAFLMAKAQPDLAALYNRGMEVQVNVVQGDGQRIDAGQLGGRAVIGFTDNIETWGAYRIPRKAMSEPEDNDGPQMWNFDKHVEGIGMTGWDWLNRRSLWVAYDFDAITGHSDKHQKKLNDAQLQQVHDTVLKLPFVTLRRSTSGKGLHLYVLLEPIETANHTEHAALARAILSYMSGLTGFNFSDKVDVCGSNMWVWHRKSYTKQPDGSLIQNDGLKLIKSGGLLPSNRVPCDWREHAAVVSRRSNRTVPKMNGVTAEQFEELSGQRAKVRLDEDHVKLINWLNDRNAPGHWQADQHMLICHTHHLAQAHKALGMRGEFHTSSTGKDDGFDINCFAFPIKGGAWAIRRYGTGTGEHKYWVQDGKGWTRCYLNRELSLSDVARLFDAIELENGGYQFERAKVGVEAMKRLGVTVDLPEWILGRSFKVKEHRQDYKLVCTIPTLQNDAPDMQGWLVERNTYRRVFNNPRAGVTDEQVALADYDDMVRHIISENGEDLGWVVSTDDGTWRHEPVNHVKLLLVSRGIGKKDIEIILGQAISNAWIIVNQPFQPEYPGDRQWNRSSARFKIAPTLDGEALSFPTWLRITDHCGRSLDAPISEHSWCKANGITTGGQYLRLWFASLIRHPQSPLPYLAFYGPQDSGKSTIHEAFCQLILDGGYMDGAMALSSQGNFNGELQDSILCTLEEVDLRNKMVIQRMKDWVTSAQISVHIKGQTPYKAPNYTHWIQCVNDRDFIPVFPGDTRVVVSFVDSIPNEEKIPKRELWTMLTKEAPDFLASLLAMDIPDSRDRLMLPVIKTADKVAAEYSSMDPVQQFFQEKVYRIPGAYCTLDELHSAFINWIGIEESGNWGKNKFSKSVPQDIPHGRISGINSQLKHFGNVTLNSNVQPGPRWVSTGLFMKKGESLDSLSASTGK